MELEAKVSSYLQENILKKICSCFLHNFVFNRDSPKNGGKLHLMGCNQHKMQLPLEVIGISLDA